MADTRQDRVQGAYHEALFHALHDWDRSWAGALDVAGDRARAEALGLDQLGHFGAPGYELVADEIRGALPDGRCDLLAELGCGFGGGLRHVLRSLRQHGVDVRTAVGLDIVAKHLAVFAAIERTGPPSGAVTMVADARALPLPDASLTVAICTGSLPHFADAERVFVEANRTLVPGGLLVMTEEVSLTRPGRAVSARFREYHPPGVFFLSDTALRRQQLERAGFTDLEIRDLTPWAVSLLHDRLKVMRLFAGDVAAVFGEAETARLYETLDSAYSEYRDGAIIPAITLARKPF